MTAPEDEKTRLERLAHERVIAGLEVRTTDDGKKQFISLPVPMSGKSFDLKKAEEWVRARDVNPHAGKRELSVPTHGHHITLFYDCDPVLGKQAVHEVQSLKAGPLNWDDCVFELEPTKIGEPNAKRRNSQCWVLKIRSWPALVKAHELAKLICVPDEGERAKQRAFMPHVTIGYVQDATASDKS